MSFFSLPIILQYIIELLCLIMEYIVLAATGRDHLLVMPCHPLLDCSAMWSHSSEGNKSKADCSDIRCEKVRSFVR